MSVSVQFSPCPILQFFDNAGNPAVGGSLLTQVGGVNYPTYSDSAGTTALPNPIPLNSRGEVSTSAGTSSALYLQVGVSYTFTLKDANSNQLWSLSGIVAPGGNSYPTSSGTANAQIITNPTPISFGAGIVQWFKPISANTGPVTLNVDNTGAIALLSFGAACVGGELSPSVPALIFCDGTNWNIINPCISESEQTIFTANGNFTPRFTASYYIMAIGGGGGGASGGGSTASTGGGLGGFGGSGGQLGFTTQSLTAGSVYAVVIGGGGAGGAAGSTGANGNDGTAGSNTTFNAVNVASGGAGGKAGLVTWAASVAGGPGGNGGGNAGGQGSAGAASPSAGTAAAANTGGGGGGGGGSNSGANRAGGAGGNGGSGILLIRRT